MLRHGKTFANDKPHIIGGRTNHTRLMDVGYTQTWEVGEGMLRHNITPVRVDSSPAVRTIESVCNVLRVMGSSLDVYTHDDLQELSQGDWTGLLREEVFTPELKARREAEGRDFKGPNGESMGDTGERYARWVHKNIPLEPTTDGPGHELYLVSGHGVAIRSYVARQEGWTHAEVMANMLGNASLTLMLPRDGEFRLAAFNATPEQVAQHL